MAQMAEEIDRVPGGRAVPDQAPLLRRRQIVDMTLAGVPHQPPGNNFSCDDGTGIGFDRAGQGLGLTRSCHG
jgi:hypothetical protein